MTTTPIKSNQVQQTFLQPLSPEQRARAIAMLEEWCNVNEEDAQEQRETGEYLRKALDEERERVGSRTLFL
jgi:O-succinylbenzoate synthase